VAQMISNYWFFHRIKWACTS